MFLFEMLVDSEFQNQQETPNSEILSKKWSKQLILTEFKIMKTFS